uniref:(northern house mosquito) hypothetical protein n=1 Tax=Culex pipiens TaxID=7175 RepID=A0A8D8PJL0_CULPI
MATVMTSAWSRRSSAIRTARRHGVCPRTTRTSRRPRRVVGRAAPGRGIVDVIGTEEVAVVGRGRGHAAGRIHRAAEEEPAAEVDAGRRGTVNGSEPARRTRNGTRSASGSARSADCRRFGRST